MSAVRNGQSPEMLANEAVAAVLKTQWDGEPAVRLDSPPGAGKTWVVGRLAVQAMELHREQCMISTQTNEQAFDLARRLASGFPNRTLSSVCKEGASPARRAERAAKSGTIRSGNDLPVGPSVV